MTLSLSFWFPFLNFVQPGVLWPVIDGTHYMLVLGILALVGYGGRKREYPLGAMFAHPIFMCMIAFLLWRGVTLIFHGLSAAISETLLWFPIHLFAVTSVLLIGSPEQLRRYVWGVMLGSGFVVWYGIYAISAGLRERYGGLAGAYGNYENHNDYTFVILQVLPFLFMAWKSGRGLVRGGLLLATMAACVYGVYLSQSRGGMIGLVFEVILIVWMTMSGRWRRVVLPLVLVFGLAGISLQYERRAETSGESYTEADAEGSRYELWNAGFNMFIHNPIMGVGSRLFSENSRDYGELSHDQWGKNAHNTYIEIVSETGAIGFGLFALMLFYGLRELRRPTTACAGESIEWIRVATLIAYCTILIRALLDAKGHDWSWYTFSMIAIACYAHRNQFANGGSGHAIPGDTMEVLPHVR